jgi:hypothetical protein
MCQSGAKATVFAAALLAETLRRAQALENFDPTLGECRLNALGRLVPIRSWADRCLSGSSIGSSAAHHAFRRLTLIEISTNWLELYARRKRIKA